MIKASPSPELRDSIGAALAATGTCRDWEWVPITADARHEIWRSQSSDGSLIVKVYRPLADRYYHHRWRREERALDLFEREAPGLGPRPYAALLAQGEFAAIAMEDLGSESVAERLITADANERSMLLENSISTLTDFRHASARLQGLLRALAFQSDLDRITRTTLRRRLAIAVARLQNPSLMIEPDAAPRRVAPDLPWQDLDAAVITPLVHAPRRVVHNGFSPLNLMRRTTGQLAIIDFETISVASPAIDAADLLTFPGFQLLASTIDHHASTIATIGLADGLPSEFWAAAAERCLTYAATAAVRTQRLGKSRATEQMATYSARQQAYLRLFGESLERLCLDSGGRRRIMNAVPDITI